MCVAMRRAAGGGSVISTLDGVVFLEYNSHQDPPGVYRPEGENDGAVSSFHSTPEAHMTNLDTPKCGCCFIISLDVLRELAQGEKVESADRATYQRAYAMTQRLRLVREGHRLASLTGHQSGLGLRATAVAKQPVEHLFDCKHATTLPGSAVPDPTTDQAFKTVFDTTAKVAEFYKTVLGRNSIDNQGMDLVSSLNYDQDYQNAFWDGLADGLRQRRQQGLHRLLAVTRRHRPRTHARRDPARKRTDLRRPVGRPQREHQRLLRRRLRAVAGEQAGKRRPAAG